MTTTAGEATALQSILFPQTILSVITAKDVATEYGPTFQGEDPEPVPKDGKAEEDDEQDSEQDFYKRLMDDKVCACIHT